MTQSNFLIKLLTSLAIAAFCFWLAAKHVDPGELRRAFSNLDKGYLALAVVISLAIQILRALRWKLELSPLKQLPFTTVWQVVAVAYMMINVLPFRLGEPVRPVLMSHKGGLSIAAIVANWVFEKMMDLAAIVLFLHLALVFAQPPELGEWTQWSTKAARASLLVFAVLLVLVVGFWLRGENFAKATFGKVLPQNLSDRLTGILVSARSGLQILPNKKLVALVFLITLALWSLPILSSYVLIRGFSIDAPFAAALVVFVAISAGTAIPPPPGMIGVFQIASVVALGLYGVPKADALAFGIALNAVQFLTLVAQGLVALPFLGVGIGDVTREAVSKASDREYFHADRSGTPKTPKDGNP